MRKAAGQKLGQSQPATDFRVGDPPLGIEKSLLPHSWSPVCREATTLAKARSLTSLEGFFDRVLRIPDGSVDGTLNLIYLAFVLELRVAGNAAG